MEAFEMQRANEEDPRGCRFGFLLVLIFSSCVYLMFALFEGSSCFNVLASWIPYFVLIVNKRYASRPEFLLALSCACKASLYFFAYPLLFYG
jgi:hypothetical protein